MNDEHWKLWMQPGRRMSESILLRYGMQLPALHQSGEHLLVEMTLGSSSARLDGTYGLVRFRGGGHNSWLLMKHQMTRASSPRRRTRSLP